MRTLGTETLVKRTVIRVAAVAGLLGWFALILSIGILGGTAANGKIVDGQHYLGEHGRYVPVSLETWRLSVWITRLGFTSLLVAGAAFAVLRSRPDPELEAWA